MCLGNDLCTYYYHFFARSSHKYFEYFNSNQVIYFIGKSLFFFSKLQPTLAGPAKHRLLQVKGLRFQPTLPRNFQKYSKLLSSVSFQNRRKSRIYLFLQSCFQDWIVVVDILNNFGSNVYCANRTCIVLVTMGFGVMVYAADGYVK